MYIEGIVNKEHLELMKKAGYEIDFEIHSKEDAIKLAAPTFVPGVKDLTLHGNIVRCGTYDEMDFTTDAYVRFYVDMDIEKYITAFDCVECLEPTDLPLLIGAKNRDILEAVENKLKEN